MVGWINVKNILVGCLKNASLLSCFCHKGTPENKLKKPEWPELIVKFGPLLTNNSLFPHPADTENRIVAFVSPVFALL